MKLYKQHNTLEVCKAEQGPTGEDKAHWEWMCRLLRVDYIYFCWRSVHLKPFFEHKHFIFQGHQRRLKAYKFLIYWGWDSWDYGATNKLWVDDLRDPPSDDWDVARTYEDAVEKLEKNHYYIVSLDHDLGQPDGQDGYGIVKWLVKRKMGSQGHMPLLYKLHTANPVGHENMKALIDRYLRR